MSESKVSDFLWDPTRSRMRNFFSGIGLDVFSHSRLDYGHVLPNLFSVQFSSIQFSSIQFNSIQFRPVQFNSALGNTFTLTYHYSFQFSSIQFSSVQISSVQFSSIQFSSTVLCRKEQALWSDQNWIDIPITNTLTDSKPIQHNTPALFCMRICTQLSHLNSTHQIISFLYLILFSNISLT